MDIKTNRLFALIWRIVGMILGIFGIAFCIINSGVQTFTYFTLQSNVFVVVLFGYLAVKTLIQIIKEGKNGEVASANPHIQLATVLFISITFFVYWSVLSWVEFDMTGASETFLILNTISNYILHGIVPVMAIIDAILYMIHGKIKYKYAFIWLSYLAFYIIFVIVRAQVGGYLTQGSRYPYFFTDIDVLGWWSIPIMVLTFVIFYGLGRLFIYIDNKLNKNRKLEDVK